MREGWGRQTAGCAKTPPCPRPPIREPKAFFDCVGLNRHLSHPDLDPWACGNTIGPTSWQAWLSAPPQHRATACPPPPRHRTDVAFLAQRGNAVDRHICNLVRPTSRRRAGISQEEVRLRPPRKTHDRCCVHPAPEFFQPRPSGVLHMMHPMGPFSVGIPSERERGSGGNRRSLQSLKQQTACRRRRRRRLCNVAVMSRCWSDASWTLISGNQVAPNEPRRSGSLPSMSVGARRRPQDRRS